MIFLALRMLFGDRTKYLGLLFGLTFTSFLVTFAGAYFGGMMTRSFALVAETPADIWVMDPAVAAVDQTTNLPDSALNRVRNVPGVRTAVPLAVATADARFANGRFQSIQIIGVDDASLTGVPPLAAGATADDLLRPDAAVVDPGGTTGKLETPSLPQDQWPWLRPHLDAPTRPLDRGDELLVNDSRVVIVGRGQALPRFPPRPLLFTTLSNVERMLPPERRQITFILSTVAPGADPQAVADRVETDTGLRARTADEFESDTVWWMIHNSEDVGDAITMLTIAMLVGFAVTGIMMFMFTSENLRFYAVLQAMGATGPQLFGAVVAQTGLTALVGTGLGMGLCVIAGRIFSANDFPYRMLWFAPVLGSVAVILVSIAAAVIGTRSLLKMNPAAFLTGR